MAFLSGFKLLLSTPQGEVTPFQSALPADNQFQTIGGIRSTNFNISANSIDVTNKSSGEWRELLENRGVVTLSLSGDGIMDASNLQKELELNTQTQKLRWFRISREDGRSFLVKCKITSFEFSGDYDQAMTFSISLESSGGMTIKDTGGFVYNGEMRKITSFSNLLANFDYVNSNKYASPSFAKSNIPDAPNRVNRMRDFLNLSHGLPATLTYDNNIFDDTVVAIGDQNILLEYVRLTGTTPQTEPDRGRWRVTFAQGVANPFPKNIKSLRIAIGSANPVTIPLTVDNSVQNTLAFKSTAALARDPFANTNDQSIQYNFLFTDDTSSYQEINLLNADKARGGSAALDIRGRAVANRFSFPFVFLRKDQVQNKNVQFLDSLDSVITDQFVFLGEKQDNTNVVWYAYFLNVPLGSAETLSVKIQIGD